MRIGTDIIEIRRVRKVIDHYGSLCLGRIFTENEWNYCHLQGLSYSSFSACFAAKEAISKALGVGFGSKLKWISVELLHHPSGEPYIQLDRMGEACLSALSLTQIQISLSHCKAYALAVAIIA